MSNKHDIIRFRRGTAAEWANSLPQPGGEVLRLGEPGFEKDTYKLKIGDGVTPWNDLPYIAGGIGGTGGPLTYIYGTDFTSTSVDNLITSITISSISNSIDFSDFFQDLLDNNKTSSIRISSVNNPDNFIILNAGAPLTTGSDFVFNTVQLVENNLTLTNDSQYYINIDILDSSTTIDENSVIKVCSVELTGHPFFVGEPVTVYQASSETQVFDVIDNDLTLTRGTESYDGGGGLYNSELQTDYDDNGQDGPTGTEWNADGWGNLSDVQLRTYNTLYNVLNGVIGSNITNAELVMHDTINDKYYKFDFTYWQPGAGQQVGAEHPIGGFKYTRTQLWVQPELVEFIRASNETDTVDNIDNGLIIKRSSSGGGGIYNSASETIWDVSISPSGTLWNIEGWEDLSNVAEREYVSFYAATGGQLGNNVMDRQYVMHDTINDKYYTVQFTNWGSGGAFSYVRQQINGNCSGNIKFSDGSTQDTAFTEEVATDIALGVVNDALNTSLVSGSGINLSYASGVLTVSATGLALSGHTHIASNITDFNSAVSGLLPVKDIAAGSGISVGSLSGIYTITSTINSVLEANSLVTNVFNHTGFPIPKFSVVYINGGQGDQATIALAQANTESTSSKTYGITAESIDNMSAGKVIVFGALTGVNTDQFNPTAPTGDVNGTVLYLSPTVPGGVTTTKPSAPDHMVAIGTIVRTHQNAGVVEVRIQNGFELQELHNVAISGIANNQVLSYSSGNSLWQNTTLSSSYINDFNVSVSGLLPVKDIIAGTNITITSSSGNYTINSSGGGGGGTTVIQLVSSSGLATNASLGDIFDVTLDQSTILQNPTNPTDGKTIRWRITQDNVGNHGVTLDTKFVIPTSATSPLPWSTAANTTDILGATYHAGRDKWDIIAFVPGY